MLRSQRNKNSNDKTNTDEAEEGTGSKRCSDVRSTVRVLALLDADLGFDAMYGMQVRDMCMLRHEVKG